MADGDREKLWETLARHSSILVPPVHIKNGHVISERKAERALPLSGRYPMCSAWVTPRSAFGRTLLLELQRGCIRNCRYCTLPGCFGKMRYRPFESARPLLDSLLDSTEVEQVGLVTPEAGDYPDISALLDYLEQRNKGVSFASLRLDRLTERMLLTLSKGGRHSITVAPETGCDELRFSCGKKFTNELIIDKLKLAKSVGIAQVKLYFMIGLPGETDDDIAAIAGLCRRIISETSLNLILSVSPFVPKPGTPWKNEPFIGRNEIRRRYAILSSKIREIKKKAPQMRLTSPKEAENEFELAWYGYDESIMLAERIENGGKIKIGHSSRDKTLIELDSLWRL